MNHIERWEQAWHDYVDALDLDDAVLEVVGESFVSWCGVARQRLDQAMWQLRSLDPSFCERLGI